MTLTGKVTQFEWTNPHAYIEIDVPDGSESAEALDAWSSGSTSILMQGGWKFTDVKPEQTITVVLSPLRNGEPGGLLVRITLRDGRVLSNGPGPAGGTAVTRALRVGRRRAPVRRSMAGRARLRRAPRRRPICRASGRRIVPDAAPIRNSPRLRPRQILLKGDYEKS